MLLVCKITFYHPFGTHLTKTCCYAQNNTNKLEERKTMAEFTVLQCFDSLKKCIY